MNFFDNIRMTPETWDQTENLLLLVLLFNLAMCLVGLAVAYLGEKPSVFLKEPTGELPFVSWMLFWPMHLYSNLVWRYWRHATREPVFCEVMPRLYLGRRLGYNERERLAPLGELAVVDLTAEFAEPQFIREENYYLCLPTLDLTAPSYHDTRAALEFIHGHRAKRPVYVHCALGHGRAAFIVLLYAVQQGHFASLEEGYARLKSLRYGVHLTRAQLREARKILAANQ